jgi:hypothetical protein
MESDKSILQESNSGHSSVKLRHCTKPLCCQHPTLFAKQFVFFRIRMYIKQSKMATDAAVHINYWKLMINSTFLHLDQKWYVGIIIIRGTTSNSTFNPSSLPPVILAYSSKQECHQWIE